MIHILLLSILSVFPATLPRHHDILTRFAPVEKWQANPAALNTAIGHIDACGEGVFGQGVSRCGYKVEIDDNFFLHTNVEDAVRTPVNWERLAQLEVFDVSDLPHNFDWREERQGICPGKAQGSCGSCWAFGTMHVMQDVLRLMLPTEPCRDIAAQWMVDCEPDDFYGCRGGYFAFNKFLKTKNRGPVYTADYGPYVARDQRCKSGNINYDVEHGIEKWAYVDQDPDQMRAAIFKRGPIAITERAFGANVQGVYNRCSPGGGTNHITSLAGWKHLDPETLKEVESGGDLYWIRRNSWRGTGDSHYGILLVKATSGHGSNGRACQNMGQSAAFVYGLDNCAPQPEAEPGVDRTLVRVTGTEKTQLGAPPKSGHNYSWTPVVGLDDPTSSQPWASPTQTTEYTLEVKTVCGTAKKKVTVEVVVPLSSPKE